MSSQDQNFQAALARARSRAEDDVVKITRVFYDEEFTFSFKPRATPDAIEIVGQLAEQTSQIDLANADARTLDMILKSITKFLDSQAAGDTSERIAELMRDGPQGERALIGVEELFDLQRAVVEAVAGRPTTSASSSPAGSSEDGKPSTDGALPETSTPSS